MAISFTHLALHVRDVDACVLFYQEYAEMKVVRNRLIGDKRIVWLAEPGKESEFIIVVLPGGPGRNQVSSDFSHLGFALESLEAVDDIARQARECGILEWEPKQEAYPVGYYCGIRDPDGNFVEFSYGQPLGPGASGPVP